MSKNSAINSLFHDNMQFEKDSSMNMMKNAIFQKKGHKLLKSFLCSKIHGMKNKMHFMLGEYSPNFVISFVFLSNLLGDFKDDLF